MARLGLQLIGLAAGLCFAEAGQAQTVDAAVEVVSGYNMSRGDLIVAVVDLLPDERWEVVGTCTNRPTLRVRFAPDYLAPVASRRVQLFRRGAFVLPDRRICITNARSLDAAARRLLKLTG
jgi:hypothetical protein